MQIAVPKYNVGDIVAYVDRQGRSQQGRVYEITAKWTFWGHQGDKIINKPYMTYRLQHPTYRNGAFETSESTIVGLVKAAADDARKRRSGVR